MKKRLICLLTSLSAITLLSGCFNSIPDMDSKEEERVTLYMADAVLEYETGYESDYLEGDMYEEALQSELDRKNKLKDQLQKEADQKKAKEEAAKAEQIKVSSSKPAEVTYEIGELSSLMGIEDIAISYNGYDEKTRYPDDDPTGLSFAMSAKEGHEFIVLKFDLLSLSGNARDVDIASHVSGFRIKIGDNKYSVYPSMIDDFQYFEGSVMPDAPTSLVLISEIPDTEIVENLQLVYVSADKQSYNIILN